MEEKKTTIIVLLEILKKYSDEDHILSQKEINDHMSNTYNITLDRRSFYRNIDMLLDLGYDISTFKDNGKGYYLRERDFEKSEVFLLCNAIHASNFIPPKASKELIDKLLQTQSKYTKEEFRENVFVENALKKENKEFFLNIEILSEAIKNKQVISFNYTKYDQNKKVVNRREEPYIISPYYLVYANEKTYLVAKSSKHNDFTHFRVDKMKNIKTTNDDYVRLGKREDPYEYAKNKIYMFKGEENRIVLKCDNSILDDIIDKFGKGITIQQSDDDHFITYVKASEEGVIFYVLQYIEHMEVLEPKELRIKINKILTEGAKKHK